jgi:hypothetical protein
LSNDPKFEDKLVNVVGCTSTRGGNVGKAAY